jgi:hypothetical protein
LILTHGREDFGKRRVRRRKVVNPRENSYSNRWSIGLRIGGHSQEGVVRTERQPWRQHHQVAYAAEGALHRSVVGTYALGVEKRQLLRLGACGTWLLHARAQIEKGYRGVGYSQPYECRTHASSDRGPSGESQFHVAESESYH